MLGIGLVLALLLAWPAPVTADHEFPGHARTAEVVVASRRGPNELTMTLYAPAQGLFSDPRPAIAVAPGGGQDHTGVPWVGRSLAAHGYVVLVGDPGSGAECQPVDRVMLSCSNEDSIDVVLSAVDWFHDPQGLFEDLTIDHHRIGAAGYSIGARAVSYAQSVEPRIKAVVALDNLARDLEGDTGSPSGQTAANHLGRWKPIAPRVPAMGQASDATGLLDPLNDDPDIKKAAWEHWRRHGLPVMQLVVRDTDHFTYASGTAELAWWTRAWFDRYLLEDPTALDRLVGPQVLGAPRNDLLSTRFRSAAYLPEAGIDCPDLTAC